MPSNLPDKNSAVDQQVVQVNGPDGAKFTFRYDAETNTWIAQTGPVIIPSSHGHTHISEDPVPEATLSLRGLMSADDKAKLDALNQTKIGVHSFIGQGFPDDGGFLSGEIILASGSESLVIEKIGNLVRFTVNNPVPITCGLEECAQIFWIQDETDTGSIRPPACAGKLLGVNATGELKAHLFPKDIIINSANPSEVLSKRDQYPAFIFKRYENSVTPGKGRIDVVLERNTNTSTKVGWSMTPGPLGVAETVFFTGHDDQGNQIRFEFLPEVDEPDLLGAILYKGHTLTRQRAVIVDYTTTTTSTNQYECRFWDIENGKPVGDSFVATNIWRHDNPENSANDLTAPRAMVLDATSDILPVGSHVDIWEFQIGEVNGVRQVRRYFKHEPRLNPDHLFALRGAVRFGHVLGAREEVDPGVGETDLTAFVDDVEDIRLHERQEWGITGFEDPILLFDDYSVTGSTLFSGNVSAIGEENENLPSPNVAFTVVETLVVNELNNGEAEFPNLSALAGRKFPVYQNSTNDITIGELGPLELASAVAADGGVPTEVLVFDLSASASPSGVPINNRFVADIDSSRPGLVVTNLDPDEDRELPVFLWHRANYKDVYVSALVGRAENSNFPPVDVLLRAPVDSFDDVYMQVLNRGEFAEGPFAGRPYITVSGVHHRDLPKNGTLRVLTATYRDTVWGYDHKIAFGGSVNGRDVVLVGRSGDPFLFDEDFVPGDSAADPTASPTSSGGGAVPDTTTVVQLLRHDYTSPCLRIEFSVVDQTGSESVQMQFKGGILDMSQPYELDLSNPKDNYVRGMQPGNFTISSIYTQSGFITTGVEEPEADPSGFIVYEGGELPAAVDGETELFNRLEILYRGSQMWVWWNKLLITPDTTASAALATPVAVTTPYFPVTSDFPVGKVALRLWPGAVVRDVRTYTNVRLINEFMHGQVELSGTTGSTTGTT